MLKVDQVSNLKLSLSHDLLHICQRTYIHTYTQSWNHCAHFPWNKTKQRTPRLYEEETEGMPWWLLAAFPTFWYKYGSHSSRSASIQGPVSRACHALGCDRAAWMHCRPRVHRYNTLHSLSGHRDCKVNGTGSSETNSREKRGTGWQVTDMNRRHRQVMGHAPCLFLSPRGSS